MLAILSIVLGVAAIGIMVAVHISMNRLEPRIKSLEDYYAAKRAARHQ